MTKTRAVLLAALGCAIAAVAWAQTLRPGEYEVTMEVQMPGAPPGKATTAKGCLSPADAQDFRGYFNKMLSQANADCTFSPPTTAGNKMSWDTKCGDVTASSEITFVADGYTGVVRMTVGGMVLTTNTRGRWVGAACTTQ